LSINFFLFCKDFKLEKDGKKILFKDNEKEKNLFFNDESIEVEMNIPNVLRQKFKRVSLNETPEFPFLGSMHLHRF